MTQERRYAPHYYHVEEILDFHSTPTYPPSQQQGRSVNSQNTHEDVFIHRNEDVYDSQLLHTGPPYHHQSQSPNPRYHLRNGSAQHYDEEIHHIQLAPPYSSHGHRSHDVNPHYSREDGPAGAGHVSTKHGRSLPEDENFSKRQRQAFVFRQPVYNDGATDMRSRVSLLSPNNSQLSTMTRSALSTNVTQREPRYPETTPDMYPTSSETFIDTSTRARDQDCGSHDTSIRKVKNAEAKTAAAAKAARKKTVEQKWSKADLAIWDSMMSNSKKINIKLEDIERLLTPRKTREDILELREVRRVPQEEPLGRYWWKDDIDKGIGLKEKKKSPAEIAILLGRGVGDVEEAYDTLLVSVAR